MSTSPNTLAFVLDQLSGSGPICARKMFGEYGLFLDGKMAAVLCNDQLYMRPTPEGRSFADGVPEVSPFPRAMPYLLVEGDRLEDRDWVSTLLRITADAMSPPKPTKPRNPCKLDREK